MHVSVCPLTRSQGFAAAAKSEKRWTDPRAHGSGSPFPWSCCLLGQEVNDRRTGCGHCRPAEEGGDAPGGGITWDAGASSGMAACPHLHPHPPGPGGRRSRGPCHPGRPHCRTEPLPSRQPPPTPLAPCLRGRAAEADAAGASQPVMRQIHQAAAAEGAFKMLDPTLITCQPERPNVAQKLWNKRAISYYF